MPDGDYEIALGKADVMRTGADVTVVGWGGQLRVLEAACDMAEKERGISCELIDLRTLMPWDVETVRSKGDSQLTTHDAQLTTRDSRRTTHDSRLTTHDSRLTTHDSRLMTHDARLTTYDL